ncbi:hypothetical protein ACFOKI_11900 [Sphingomonas qilianensis]|uniref:DUF2029 domain-containing protein n=1 Tax=Sphingomonas qilianensis TaxID=1736690 RepID=A0ABU9XS80_9SPHN
MPRPLTPLWLTAPSRFATLSPTVARWALGVLTLLLAASLSALIAPAPSTNSRGSSAQADTMGDIVLYESIVSGVHAGGNYYAVAAAALRSGNYPLRPFVAFRLPTLAMVQSLLPPTLTIILLYALAAGVFLAWFFRLRDALAGALPRAVALILLAGGMAAFVQSALIGFHETWAGLLIALSLALRRPGRWVDAAAFGMMAMLVRETAALFVVLMAGAALIEGRRREAYGWAATLALFAVVVTLHAYAVSQVVRPLDPTSPGWSGLLGFGFFVQTMTVSTALLLAPSWLAALLVGLSLFGWATWRDPLAARALAVFVAYAALLALFGRVDTFYWGLMIAPTMLIGLAFAPDGVRDLMNAARAARKITITRLTR